MNENYFNTYGAYCDVLDLLKQYGVKVEVNKANYTSSIYIKVYKPRRKTIYSKIRVADHFSNRDCANYDIDITKDNARSEIEKVIFDIAKSFKLNRCPND